MIDKKSCQKNNKQSSSDKNEAEKVSEAEEKTTADFSRPCPVCGEPISMDEKVCPKCGYYESIKEGGYKPMTQIQTKKIRTILFFVLMAVAIVVYILLRNA